VPKIKISTWGALSLFSH